MVFLFILAKVDLKPIRSVIVTGRTRSCAVQISSNLFRPRAQSVAGAEVTRLTRPCHFIRSSFRRLRGRATEHLLQDRKSIVALIQFCLAQRNSLKARFARYPLLKLFFTSLGSTKEPL